MAMRCGHFITIEGGEGVGKTTQARLLAERLSAIGERVVLTREPGGCGAEGAEVIRSLLARGELDRWDSLSETLLLYAARCDHIRRTIRPSLERGEWVICDRFDDSSRAYQGAGRGVSAEKLDALRDWVVGDTMPDLTLILDLPADIGLARARRREQAIGDGEDRYERASVEWHHRLLRCFHDIAGSAPRRCVLIDASQAEGDVLRDICEVIAARWPENDLYER